MPGNDVIVRMDNKKDRLLQYLKKGGNDPELEELWNMFIWIEDKLRSMHRRHVVNVVMKRYDIKSRSWANKLVNETMSFAGMAHKPDREYLRAVHLDGIILDIKLAREAGQFKVLPALYKELRLWLNPYGETADEDKLQLHQFNINIQLSDETANVPLDVFYKLKQSEREAISDTADDSEFVSWEEIKQQLSDKKES